MQLRALARLHGIQTSYRDAGGAMRTASRESLVAIIAAVSGVELGSPEDVKGALRAEVDGRSRRLIEPVVVAWEGRRNGVGLQGTESNLAGRIEFELEFERGGETAWTDDASTAAAKPRGWAEQAAGCRKRVPLPGGLPLGYHRLRVKAGRQRGEAMLISAPRKARQADRRLWGVSMPLHALPSAGGWGTGDFGDLAALLEWTNQLGGSFVSTLPFLAGFLEEPFDPSPYSPASRLFWNELFVNVENIPELSISKPARDKLESSRIRKELADLAAGDLVDYRRAMAAKRPVLEELAASFFSSNSPRRDEFELFVKGNPRVKDYGAFRAECDRRRRPWQEWPQLQQKGHLEKTADSERLGGYHMYVQWLAEQQIGGLGRSNSNLEGALYLDFPLGVHPSSYDAWRERDSFAQSASAGAPPDVLFREGQDWGFPPLHPGRIRANGFGYSIACLRHLARQAAILRIDHVMSLHRLFWVPKGMSPIDGVYVRYPHDEMYAILTLESHRSGASIVGEDLGTVPGYVRRRMQKHGILRSSVMQYDAVSLKPGSSLPAPPADSLAALNNHDMPPFAAFWKGLDISRMQELGFRDQGEAEAEFKDRETIKRALVEQLQQEGHLDSASELEDAGPVMRAAYERLGASAAKFVAVTLEDLWLETRSQNIPGTLDEQHPNWRHKSRHSLAQFTSKPSVKRVLGKIDGKRRVLRDGSTSG